MSTLFKRNGIWWINYSVDGKRRRISTHTRIKKLAVMKQAEIDLQRLMPRKDKLDDDLKTHFQQVGAFLLENRSPSYSRIEIPRLRNWSDFFDSLNIDHLSRITPEHVDRFIVEILTDKSDQTKKHYLKTLKAALNLAVTWGKIKHNPIQRVKPPKIVKGKHLFYEPKEVKLLIEAASPKLRPVIIILVNTGMRRGEFWALRWRDIDFANSQIRITSYDDHTTKSKRSRTVAMNEQCLEAIKGLPEGKLDDAVYRLAPSIECLAQNFKRLVRRLEMNGSLHTLRHTFASLLVRQGVDMRIVQELLGHASIVQTMEYSYLAPSAHAEQVRKLEFR